MVDAEGQAHADLEHAGRLAAIARHTGDRCLQPVEIAADRFEEALAGFRQRQLARGTLEQPDTEIALEHRHVAADRRRRQRQPPRRGRETACLRAADKGLQVRKRFGHLIFNEHLQIKSLASL